MQPSSSNIYTENFELVSLILLKSPDSRSYDDVLFLRSFVFRFGWIREFFKPIVHLGLINDFCRNVGLGTYTSGQILHRQGDIGDKIYFMIDGNIELMLKYRVDLTKDEFEERERIEHRIQAGMTFGEEVLTAADIRPSTAVCVSQNAYVMTYPKSSLRLLAKELKLDAQTAGQPEQYRSDSKNYIMSVLSKSKAWRNDNEIDAVAKYLKQRIPFFEKFSLDQQLELCRIAETISLRDQHILFKQGHVGQAFYIVLHGSVDVYVAGADKDSREQQSRDGLGGGPGGSIASASVHSLPSVGSNNSGMHQSGSHSVHSTHSAQSMHSHRSVSSHYSNVEGYGRHVHTIP